jgi:hypothetical protein
MSSTGGYVGAYTSDTACIGYGCGGLGPGNAEPNGTIDSPAGDVSISLGQSVTFAGTSSDPDNNTPLAFRWSFGAGSGIADSTVEDPGAKTFNSAGTFNVTFTVTDSKGMPDSSPATRTITVIDPNISGPIAKTAWSVVYVDSQETAAQDGRGVNAIDGSASTLWHTQWQAASPPPPHEIQVNLGASYAIDGFRYLPRQDANDNGTFGSYEFYVSIDGVLWGTPVATGTFTDTATEKEVRFPAVTGNFVRLRELTSAAGDPYGSMAELGVLGKPAAQTAVPPDVTNTRRTDSH